MRRRGIAVGGVLAALVAVVAIDGSGAAQESSSSTAMIALGPWQEDQVLDERGSPYRYVVVRDVLSSTRRKLAAFKRANPRTRILLYTNAGFMVHDRRDPEACDYWPFNGDGADFCEVTKRHEDWFLHRPPAFDGEPVKRTRLRSEGYPSSWAANIANAGYRKRWVRTVLRRLRGGPQGGSGVRVDGVFMDDLNMRPGHGLDGRIAELDDARYRAAATEFGSRVAARLRRAGFMTMANVALDPHEPADRAGLLELAGAGVMIHREYFVRYIESPVFTTPAAGRGNDWLTELELFEQTQAAGSAYMALAYGGGREADVARYARATFLLGWDGRSPSALAFRTTDRSNPRALGQWQTEIGTPIEPRTQVQGQSWIRRYSDGVAIVNSDPLRPQTIFLERGYRTPLGLCLSFVELPPGAGAVMPHCII